MENKPVIEIDNLFHNFKKHMALNGVSFTVEKNSLHGFVGPNGAGKTTTLKILATLLVPSSKNSVRVFGLDVVKNYQLVRTKIGFMPDHFSMYRQMTVFEYLDFFAAAYGLSIKERDRTINDVLTLTDMDSRKDESIKALSRGMQQRVSLARVLVHDPQLLLLDEPASGLDPRARIELMEILRELRHMGKTIFISSHILSELADLCDSVTILDIGKVKYSGKMEGLLSQGDESNLRAFRIRLTENSEAFEDALRKVEGVVNVSDGDGLYKVELETEKVSPNKILSTAIDCGGEVREFREDRKHLNQAFMDLTESGVRGQ